MYFVSTKGGNSRKINEIEGKKEKKRVKEPVRIFLQISITKKYSMHRIVQSNQLFIRCILQNSIHST